MTSLTGRFHLDSCNGYPKESVRHQYMLHVPVGREDFYFDILCCRSPLLPAVVSQEYQEVTFGLIANWWHHLNRAGLHCAEGFYGGKPGT